MQRKAALEELLQYIRILILDDNQQVGMSTMVKLQQINYPHVYFTDDINDAWAKLPQTNILLIDHYLDNSLENGIEFTKRAKAEYGPNLDVIIYSGSVDKLAENALAAGATACLEKPLNFDYLRLWITETARRIWYEKILNAIPDEVIVIEPDGKDFGKLHYVNKTKKDRFEEDGKPLEYDFCWRRFERQGDGTKACAECLSREAYREGRIVRNYWNYINWNGNHESVDIHAAPILDQVGKIRGIVEACRDRTLRDEIEKNLQDIEKENNWAERLSLFLNGFKELGYSRVRFYQKRQKNGRSVYQGIYAIGMPDNFDIHQYCYDSENDMPTQIVEKSKYPALFLVKKEDHFKWSPHPTTRNVYRVYSDLVPNNHVLAKQRWIDIPIIADRKIVAKVSIEPDDVEAFISNHDLKELKYYADWAGQALWNAEQRDNLRLKDELSELIIDMNQRISKMPVHQSWIMLALKRVSKVLDTSGCSLFLLEGYGKHARLHRRATYVQDIHGNRVRNVDIEEEYGIGSSIVGGTFEAGRYRCFNNMEELAKNQGKPGIQPVNLEAYNYYCDHIGEPVKNVICVPLRSSKKRYGVIRVINKRRQDAFGNRDFTEHDIHALQALAGQIAVGFDTNELIEQLQDSHKFKQFITQEYSHTLKNLMQPVISIAGVLKRESTDQEMWDLLENEIKKMRTTTNTMLHLVQAEETTVKLNLGKTNIRHMFEEVIKPYLILASDKNMEIRIAVAEDVPEVVLDEQLMYDAVANLLDNAIKYGKPDTYIKLAARLKSTNLLISVADVGEVIPRENRARIFDKFFLGNHNVDKIRQLGLGLTYVKVVTEAHGGKVFVDPNFTIGAKIIISIPLDVKREEKKRNEKDFNG